MFVKSFRIKDLFFAGAVVLLSAAIGLNLLLLGTRALAREPETFEETGDTPLEKVVYLTFDDGPSVVTGEVLDVLKEEGVKATFFVIGATTKRGIGLYQRILAEGHALGLHSYSHRYGEIYASSDAFIADQERLLDHLETTCGTRPSIFRFPGGSTNRYASGETLEKIKAHAKEEGLVWFDWNAIAGDDGALASPAEEMFKKVVSTAGDREKIVVLMHDDALRVTAPACVRMLISRYRELGYAFEPLTPDSPACSF